MKLEIENEQLNSSRYSQWCRCFGENSKMDDNWVGAKHQHLKSALTLFAQDGKSRHLLYANTDIDREDETNEIVNFVNYWRDVRGIIEQTLVFDSKLTTYDILEELDAKDIKFITLMNIRSRVLPFNLSYVFQIDFTCVASSFEF